MDEPNLMPPTTGTGDANNHNIKNGLTMGAGTAGLIMIVSGVVLSTGWFGVLETKEFFIWGPTLFGFATGMQWDRLRGQG